MIDHGIGLADIKMLWLREVAHGLFILTDELIDGKPKGPFLQVQYDSGKMFGGLDVHVFIIAYLGQLGPKGDIQRQGDFEGPVHILMGHHGHGRGKEISRNRHNTEA